MKKRRRERKWKGEKEKNTTSGRKGETLIRKSMSNNYYEVFFYL